MFKQKANLRPLGMTMILTLGFGVVIGLLVSCGMTFYGETTGLRNYYWEQIQILKDETPIIEHYAYSDGSSRHDYRTLDGKALPKSKNITDNQIYCSVMGGPDNFDHVSVPLEGPNRIRGIGRWYFIHDGNRDGNGYFVEYDALTKRCIGYLGIKRFSQNIPSMEEKFMMDGRKVGGGAFLIFYDPENIVFMISGNQLLKVDLNSKTVKSVMESSDMVSLGASEIFGGGQGKLLSNDLIGHQYLLAVRTTDRIILLNGEGKQVRSFSLPKGPHNGSIYFYLLGDDKAIVAHVKQGSEFSIDEDIFWIDSSGKILRQKEVSLVQSGPIRPSKIVNREITVAIPAPIVAAVVGSIANKDWRVDLHRAATRYLLDTWQLLLVLCTVSAVLAWICYRRQRRMALPWTGVWVGFVFVFGVPGFLGYLYHRHWPVMDNCQSCGRAVPHDREKCSSCGSEFPLPELKGIEVFA